MCHRQQALPPGGRRETERRGRGRRPCVGYEAASNPQPLLGAPWGERVRWGRGRGVPPRKELQMEVSWGRGGCNTQKFCFFKIDELNLNELFCEHFNIGK